MDLRFPIGVLFLAYGIILGVYGLVRPHDVQGINVNLVWGAVMAAFGALMLALAVRANQAGPPSDPAR